MKKIAVAALIILAVLVLAISLFFLRKHSFIILSRTYAQEYQLIDELSAQAQTRAAEGYKGRFAVVFKAEPNTEFIIISSIQAQIAAFKRIIEELQRQGYMSPELKLLKKESYLILNGNMIGNESSNADVLEIILRLIKKNPEHVIYIRGYYEDRQAWMKTPLGEQIKELDVENDALKNKLSSFFNTLPLAVYVLTLSESKPLRISYFLDNEEFAKIACTLTKKEGSVKEGPIKAICKLNEPCSYPQGPLIASIVGEDTGIDWSTMHGVQKSGEPPVWHVLSASNTTYKEKYRYFYDAFVLLKIGETFAESTITPYVSDNTTQHQKNAFAAGSKGRVSGPVRPAAKTD